MDDLNSASIKDLTKVLRARAGDLVDKRPVADSAFNSARQHEMAFLIEIAEILDHSPRFEHGLSFKEYETLVSTLAQDGFDKVASQVGVEKLPQVKNAGVLTGVDGSNLFTSISLLRGIHAAMSSFNEMRAVQNGTVAEYIAERYPPAESMHASAAFQMGFDYLAKAETFADRPGPSPDDVFRMAQTRRDLSGLEKALESKHPEMGPAQLRLVRDDFLKNIARKHGMPLPNTLSRQ